MVTFLIEATALWCFEKKKNKSGRSEFQGESCREICSGNFTEGRRTLDQPGRYR